MSLPWWSWVVAGLFVFFLLLKRLAASHRRRMLNDFVAHVRRLRPDLEVLKTDLGTMRSGSSVTFADPSAVRFEMSLYKLERALSEANSRTEAERAAILEHWVKNLEEVLAIAKRGPGVDLEHLLPRIVNETTFAPELFAKLPHRPLGSTGLHVVYVIDSPRAVAYVQVHEAEQAKLDEPALYERALENLRPRFAGLTVRTALEKEAGVFIKTGDTYDAARLLLVPEHLEAGETLAALVPDRDTLLLSPASEDRDRLHKAARTMPADEPRLCEVPLLVTRDGFARLA